LIDRTGNFEEAIMSIISSNGPNPTYFKYKKEWPLFKQYLYRPGEADELWLHLERLFTDEEYLNEFIWSRVSRRDLGT
jgi:hypothetical protein